MSQITRNQVLHRLGELDDLDVARVLSTGASGEEFQEAVALLQVEDDAGEEAPPASSPRVELLRAVLEEILENELSPDNAAPLLGDIR